MKMRTFAVVLGTVTAACIAAVNFGGCIIVGTTSSSGDGGDTASSSDTGIGGNTASSNSATSTSNSSVSSSGSSMCGVQGSSCTTPMQCCMGMCTKGACDCDPDYKCATSISMGGDPKLLCDGSMSAMLYDAYYMCACMGKCQAQCMATYCGGMGIDPPCDLCLQDTQMGCGTEAQACQNDF